MSGLRIEQEGKPPQELDFRQLAELDGQIDDVGALIPGRVGGAVTLQAILDRLQPDQDLDHLTVESTDGGFAASVPLEALRHAVIAYRVGDEPLPPGQGRAAAFPDPRRRGLRHGRRRRLRQREVRGHAAA